MTFVSLTFMLFMIMDPIGSISSFLNMVKELPPQRRQWVVVREMLIALFTMILFAFIGEFILYILGINDLTVRLSSGTILFLAALKILFSSPDNPRANLPKGEPFITPLAIPLIAGPSTLATIMLYAHLPDTQAMIIPAIVISWAIAISVLLLAGPIERILGANGLRACEKLIGMILILLALQRFFEGFQQFIGVCKECLDKTLS